MNDTNQLFTDVRELFAQDSALAALVGSRVYRGMQPQGAALPCVLMHHIGGEEINTSARTEAEGDERQTSIQFDCLATTASQSSEICSALRAALESARHREPAAGQTAIMGCTFEPAFTESGGSVRPSSQSAETVSRTVLTVSIHHVRNDVFAL
jgi:hypothetical protein